MSDFGGKHVLATKRSMLIRYIRVNGYRIFAGVSALLFGSTLVFAYIGHHFNNTMIVSAMIFIFIALLISAIFGVIFIEMFVLKLKKYTDSQVEQTYEKLIKMQNKSKK